jgi:aspartyl/asparaginyl-tRNA synthetase
MGTASESGAEVFKLGYFGRSAYLAQSPQFFKQMAIAAGIDRVFEIGPVFRAEPSYTSRHATEFTGVDAELAWIDGLEDVLEFEEQLLHRAITAVVLRHGEEITRHTGARVTVPDLPFPRITMARAQEVLRAGGWSGNRHDLDPEGERRIGAYLREQTGHEFAFVTHYPASVRPFYHMRPAGRPDLTLHYLLAHLRALLGSAFPRRSSVAPQSRRCRARWFARRGAGGDLQAVPEQHGGFGLGLGRVLMVMLGLDSIRDATFLFRGPTRLTP